MILRDYICILLSKAISYRLFRIFVVMIKQLFLGLIASMFLGFSVQAQKCDRVLLTGRVQDTTQHQVFYNMMVVNSTTGRGVFGQPDGSFSVYASKNDSITLSVKGYSMYGFRVVSDSNCQMKIHGILDPKAVVFDEVVVRPLKTLQQIKEERANLSMRETRQVSGIEVMQSPITALYQAFSKTERNKRIIAEMEYKNDQRKVLKELLRLYVAYDIVELEESEFDTFIEFLNVDENFLKTSSEMELITFVKDKFEHFISNENHFLEPKRSKK